MELNIFEFAAKNKVRYPYKGSITTEDLFDLSVVELDKIYKVLNAQAKQSKEESLLSTRDFHDTVLDIKIEIIKYIVASKQAEADRRLREKELAAKENKIMSIIADKDEAEMKNKSREELLKELEEIKKQKR